MPKRDKQVHHIATEEQTMANIAWAKARAMEAKSPDGLTALAKSFWHVLHEENNS